MSDLVGIPKDRFSRKAAYIVKRNCCLGSRFPLSLGSIAIDCYKLNAQNCRKENWSQDMTVFYPNPAFIEVCYNEIEMYNLSFFLQAQAMKIEAESELERLTQAREAELRFVKEQNELELAKSRQTSDIETGKFKNMVSAIGASTLQAIATSGPEMQLKMLTALGMKSTLITDGNTPINLFNTAQGLIGGIEGGTMFHATKRSRRDDESDDEDFGARK